MRQRVTVVTVNPVGDTAVVVVDDVEEVTVPDQGGLLLQGEGFSRGFAPGAWLGFECEVQR